MLRKGSMRNKEFESAFAKLFVYALILLRVKAEKEKGILPGLFLWDEPMYSAYVCAVCSVQNGYS